MKVLILFALVIFNCDLLCWEGSSEQPVCRAEREVSSVKLESPRLRAAAFNGDIDIVHRLIESGADLNAADSNENTALMWAARYGREAVANRLVEAGAC